MPTLPSPVRLGPEHAEVYRRLMLQGYAQHPDAFTSSAAERAAQPPAWWAARVAAGEAAPERVYGVMLEGTLAGVDGTLAGVAGLRFETGDKTRHKATLYGMYVPPGFRQHGLGQALVRAVLDAAAAHPGTRLVQLTVSDVNAGARRLYERCGFIAFGSEPMAMRVGEDFVAKIHMWKELT